MSEIFTAIENHDHLSISLLLPSHFNEVDPVFGRTVLMTLCRYAMHQHILRALDLGAPINSQDHQGWSSLRFAIHSGCSKTVEFLIKNGADINTKTLSGSTPVMSSVHCNNLDILKILVEAGADFDAKDFDNQTLLFYCEKNTSEEMLNYLIRDLKQDLNHQSVHGNTVLKEMVQCNNINFLKILIKAGVDASILDKYNQSLLFYCNDYTSVEMLDYLINILKLDVDHQDDHGNTVLMNAAMIGNDSLAELLIGYEANQAIKNKMGNNFKRISNI